MVAPLVLPKPSHCHVRIPSVDIDECSESVADVRYDGKLSQQHNSEHKSLISILHKPLDDDKEYDGYDKAVFMNDLPVNENEFNLDRCKNSGVLCSSESTVVSVPDNVHNPFYSLKRKSSNMNVHSRKKKAYELPPCDDPLMERCRRNAVNAKKNRDRQKSQLEKMSNSIARIKAERDLLAVENESLWRAKQELEDKVKSLTVALGKKENVMVHIVN